MPDRAYARAGGGDDDVVVLERLDVAADQRQRLALVAGVDVHLAAARLGLGELDPVAEPLEQRGGGLAHVREECVAEAGPEQGDAHGPPPPPSPLLPTTPTPQINR